MKLPRDVQYAQNVFKLGWVHVESIQKYKVVFQGYYIVEDFVCFPSLSKFPVAKRSISGSKCFETSLGSRGEYSKV